MMKHLYKISNGELISSATVIDNIPAGMAVKESDKKGVWNSTALDFYEVIQDRILSRDDYLDLFTDAEMLSIVKAANTDDIIKDSLDILNFRGRVRMSSENTINSVNYMESQGLLSTGRAEVILNG
jgi:preprotein translocase subunit Sec63